MKKVISGWDAGCLGMGVGEVRRLSIPSREGYGPPGNPAGGIPPDSDLTFEIELLSIEPVAAAGGGGDADQEKDYRRSAMMQGLIDTGGEEVKDRIERFEVRLVLVASSSSPL